MRSKIRLANFPFADELARRKPASKIDRTNGRAVMPSSGEADNNLGAKACNWGAKLRTASAKLMEAKVQMFFSGVPISGHCSRLAGGGGTLSVPAFSCSARDFSPSTNVPAIT